MVVFLTQWQTKKLRNTWITSAVSDKRVDGIANSHYTRRTLKTVPGDNDQLPNRDKHADYNPSALAMFERCPGFRNRKDDNPRRMAERGHRIHDALERDAIGDLPEEDERRVAQMCKDYIQGLVEERRPALPDHDWRELRLDIDLG